MCSHLVNVQDAVLDEVFCGSHKGPHELGQPRPNLRIQNTDVVMKQAHLAPRQQANDSDTHEKLESYVCVCVCKSV